MSSPVHRRSTSRRSVLGLLGSTSLAAGVVPAVAGTARATGRSESAPSGPVPKGLLPGGEFDQLVAQLAADDVFSGTVLLARGGRPVLTRAYGMANKSLSLPNTADTLIDLESVTKTFTAVALAQLVQQGKVDLYEKLGTYLDGFPDDIAGTVTVHQLLTHTSGMGVHGHDFSETKEFLEQRKTWTSARQVMDAIMAIIRNSPLDFTPGTQNGYSNSGMFVVGGLVEQVSGQPYHDYVRQHVFAPAGMTSTDFYTRPQVRDNPRIAHGYLIRQDGRDFTASDDFPFVGTPVNGAYSNVSDLLRYAQALRNGTLLAPDVSALFTSAKAALSPMDLPHDPNPRRFYGYGFRVSMVNNHSIFGHSGSGAATTTNLDIHPDRDWVAVILSNYGTDITPIVDLERKLISNAR